MTVAMGSQIGPIIFRTTHVEVLYLGAPSRGHPQVSVQSFLSSYTFCGRRAWVIFSASLFLEKENTLRQEFGTKNMFLEKASLRARKPKVESSAPPTSLTP